MGKRLVACTLTALLLGSCSSDGASVAQPDDEFLDSVESLCRDAAQAIRKLDVEDARAPDDLLDILSGTADDLSSLAPPRSVAKAYDQYTSNLDDQVAQIDALASARAAGDTTTELAVGDQIDALRSDNDGLVNTLRISSCRGITPARGLSVAASVGPVGPPPDTTFDTIDTTPDTTPGTDVVTPNTPLPIDDPSAGTGDTTGDTASTQTLAAYDASAAFQPIDGYTWGTVDVVGTFTPGDDAVVGPIVASYGVGVMESTDGTSVLIYATTLVDGVAWTAESTQSYYGFELAGDGTDVTLPTSGLAARVKAPAYEGTDVAVCTLGTQGFAIFADAGTDVSGLLDRFVTAQGG